MNRPRDDLQVDLLRPAFACDLAADVADVADDTP